MNAHVKDSTFASSRKQRVAIVCLAILIIL